MNKNNLKKIILKENSTIKEAIENLEKSTFQIVLIVNKKKKLVGTITDGDLRRGLLKGLSLNNSIKNLINKKYFSSSNDASDDELNEIMIKNKIFHLPILDKKKYILGLKVLREPTNKNLKKNTVVVMAGGKGSRMMPFTSKCPKPMLTIGDKPILEHILLKAKAEGFNKFVFSVNYLGYLIKNYFKDGSKWGVHIKYLNEKKPLGTAGSLSLLKPKPKIPFVVCNGDIISQIKFYDILSFHNKAKSMASMVVKPYELRNPYGVVEVSGNDIVTLKEKPISRTCVNAGVYAFDPKILNLIEKNKYLDMNVFFKKLISKSKKVMAFPAYENWIDVGKPKDYRKAKKIKKL